MPAPEIQISIAPGISVPAVVARPPTGVKCSGVTIILAHGAGADMHHPFLSAVHTELAERGHTCVKFNFPYTAQGRRIPDRAAVLESCFTAVIDYVRRDRALNREFLFIGGRSMGGRIASHLAAAGAAVDGLILLAYPLHPAGRPDRLRSGHFGDIRVPSIFFSGSRDALAGLDLLRDALTLLPAPHRLCVIEGADHSFRTPKTLGVPTDAIIAEIVASTDAWVRDTGLTASRSSQRSLARIDLC